MSVMLAAFEKAGVKQLRIQLLIVASQFSEEEWIAIHREAKARKLSEGLPIDVRKDQHMIAAAQPPKPDEGQSVFGGDAHDTDADVRSPMPEGHCTDVREDHAPIADGLPIASGEAKTSVPANASVSLPPARDTVSLIRDEGQSNTAQLGHAASADVPNSIPREGHHVAVCEGHARTADAGNPIANGEAKSYPPEKAIVHVPPAREPNAAFRAALARDRVQTNRIWLATHKTSDGRYWGKVCPYEFGAMRRDAVVADVIESVYGPFNDKQMRTPLEDLITPAMEQKIIRKLEVRHAA